MSSPSDAYVETNYCVELILTFFFFLQEVPVVIVRNKVDTLVAEGGLGKRSGADLRRQVKFYPGRENFL